MKKHVPYYKRYYYSDTEWTEDVLRWARIFEHTERRIGSTYTKGKIFYISTVFLGLDHSFTEEPHRPILYETMVFCRWCHRGMDQDMERYSTLKEAKAGHEAMVRKWKPWRKVMKHIINKHILRKEEV